MSTTTDDSARHIALDDIRVPQNVRELDAIVADYLDQAARWQTIPAAGPCFLSDIEERPA